VIAYSIGAGLRRTAATVCEAATVEALARALEVHDGDEAWHSGIVWDPPTRRGDHWQSAGYVAIDADWRADSVDRSSSAHLALPADALARVEACALPGSAWHDTPRGIRLLFVLGEQLTDRTLYERAARGASELVRDALQLAGLMAGEASPGFVVDTAALDLGRFMWSPRARVKGEARSGRVRLLPRATWPASALAERAPAAQVPQRSMVRRGAGGGVEAYHRDHGRDYPVRGAPCPVCEGRNSFKRAKTAGKWVCFHATHPRTVGLHTRDEGGVVGSQLDLDAHAAGRTPAEHLRAEGYLSAPRAVSVAAPQAEPLPEDAGAVDAPMLESNSAASLAWVLRHRPDLIGGVLEWSEMRHEAQIDRRPLEDADIQRARIAIEREMRDVKGKPLRFAFDETWRTFGVEAQRRPYHAVREYLEALPPWDGQQRIERIHDQILHVDASCEAYATTLITRWLVSAVARAMVPGCKVDTMLVLVGAQGAGKSTFFRKLAGDFFLDSAIDIDSKDALIALSTSWIAELGELASMRRASDVETVKAFLSSAEDTFRAPYARTASTRKRSFVLCGTSNPDEIIADPTGARRFWFLRIADGARIQTDLLQQYRDDVWAEALALYRQGAPWHVERGEIPQLDVQAHEYRVTDPFEGPLREWLERHDALGEVTTDDALAVLGFEPSRRSVRDQQRVSAALRSLGLEQVRRRNARVWVRRP